MKREHIPIKLLLLSDGNPRLEPSMGEDEAISNMVADQNDKLFALASDIVEHGLNPLDVIGVYPSETYSGYYEVGEGNRRICALKLLISPERIRNVNEHLYTKFVSLSKTYSAPDSLTFSIGVFCLTLKYIILPIIINIITIIIQITIKIFLSIRDILSYN